MGKFVEFVLLVAFVAIFAFEGLNMWTYFHEESHVSVARLYGSNATVVYSNFGLDGLTTWQGNSSDLFLAQANVEAGYSDKVTCVGVWMVFGVVFFSGLKGLNKG